MTLWQSQEEMSFGTVPLVSGNLQQTNKNLLLFLLCEQLVLLSVDVDPFQLALQFSWSSPSLACVCACSFWCSLISVVSIKRSCPVPYLWWLFKNSVLLETTLMCCSEGFSINQLIFYINLGVCPRPTWLACWVSGWHSGTELFIPTVMVEACSGLWQCDISEAKLTL